MLCRWILQLPAECWCRCVSCYPSVTRGFNADAEFLGSCCPVGYICGTGDSCEPPAGSSYSQSCPANHFECPSSLGYGCCQSGLACGLSSCYSTSATSYVISSAVTTTDSAGSTITSEVTRTTLVTPTLATVTLDNPGAVAKLIPSTVAKLPAVETSSSNSGGISLTQAQLGGIIGGVVVLLIAILVATFIIVRRLRKTARIVEESKRGSSGENQTRPSQKSGFGTHTVTEIDVSVDPLMQTPTIRPSRLRAESNTSTDLRHTSPARSPELSSGQSTPPAWPGQYNPVPHQDTVRHPSMESASGGYYDPARYSQITQGVSRVSYESQATQHSHGRQWSDASEVDGAHGISELDALEASAAAARRRSSGGATRPPLSPHMRQNSDGGHQRGRSDSSTPVQAPLGTVSEVGELHGFYGPIDQQVGQTAASLRRQAASQPGEAPQ
jgi:hypothetical protein